MADTRKLYNVLNGLHTTDEKLWGKLSGLTNNISGAFNADYVTIGTSTGITSSLYKIGTTTKDNFGTTGSKLATEAGTKAFVEDADSTLSTALEAKFSGAYTSGKIAVGNGSAVTASNVEIGTTTSSGFGSDNKVAVESAVTGYVADAIGDISNAITNVNYNNSLSGSIAGHTLTIGTKVDGLTIDQDNNGLKSIIQLSAITTNTGYAASYALVDAAGTKLGADINIPKDQFLTSAAYIPSTETIDLVFAVAGATGDQAPQTVSIPVSELVHEYVSGNGVDVVYSGTAAGQTTISAKIDSANNDGKYLTLGSNGIGLSGIDSAIEAAVSDAQDAANAGLEALSAALGNSATYLSSNAVPNAFTAVDDRLDDLEDTLTGFSTSATVKATTDDLNARVNALAGLSGRYDGDGYTDDQLIKWNGSEFADAGVSVGTTASGSFGTANKLATEVGAKAYADGAIAAAIAEADAIPKVSDAAGKVAKFKDDGTLESTGATVGTDSDTITTSSTASTLATEKAVAAAVKVTDDKLSGYIPLVATGNADKVPVLTSDGKLSASSVTIDTTGALASDNTKIPTEAVVSAFVDTKVNGSISGLVEDEFVLGKTATSVKTSGLTKDTEIDNTDATLSAQIPTSQAVVDYVEYGLSNLNTLITNFNTNELA